MTKRTKANYSNNDKKVERKIKTLYTNIPLDSSLCSEWQNKKIKKEQSFWFTSPFEYNNTNLLFTQTIMKKINETFTCIWCKKNIPTASKTCRNHCPHCFTSLHVDGDTPWDRATTCHGKMYPTSYEMKNGDRRILFQCSLCAKQHRNKRAQDDEIESLPAYIKTYQNYFGSWT